MILSREIIRSQYISSHQPDMTHVTLKVKQNIKGERKYSCSVTVEGRANIVSGTKKYNYDTKGEGFSDVTVTGE